MLLPDAGLLFWMLISFGVVFIILAKWGFPVIVKMVNERKEFIDHSLEVAEEANRQLANIKAEGEAVLTEARTQQMKILGEATQTREKIIAEAKEEARKEAQKELEEAKKQIRIEKEAAIAVCRDLRMGVTLVPTVVRGVNDGKLGDIVRYAAARLPGVRVFADPDQGCQMGVLSFQIQGVDCEEAGAALARRGIAVRAGLHCAPLAHQTAGTAELGTIRASFSAFNTPQEVLALVRAVSALPGKGSWAGEEKIPRNWV